MAGPATTPKRSSGVPVRTLRADVVEGPDAGASCVAGSETLSVGTAAGNDLVLSDGTVSRYHLELARGPDGVIVTDLGSTNGTTSGSVRIVQGVVPPVSTRSDRLRPARLRLGPA